ncbi:MAG: hypothetical protein DRN91_04785 [Candidatus Alkanophagales archaeon]|nr:MAG: hypothetical protein DRN91_04785 [Candidatus Alkanophagales archaeon]
MYRGFGARQPVQATEDAGPVHQFVTPSLKIMGLSSTVSMIVLPIWFAIWTWAGGNSYWSFWWGSLYLLCFAVVVAGIFGSYHFGKELIRMWEPTGQELVGLEQIEFEREKWEAEHGQSEGRSWSITITEERQNSEGKVRSLGWGFLEFERVTPAEFAYFAGEVLTKFGGDDLTYGRWTPNPFSRAQYDEITSQLESVGIIKRQGSGKNSKRYLADKRPLQVWLKHYEGHDNGG